MTSARVSAAAGLLACAGLAGAAHATVAQSGAVTVTASAKLGANPAVVDTHSETLSGVPAGLSTFARATTSAGTDTLTARGAISANWASADRGDVQIHDFGWDITANDSSITTVEPLLTAFPSGPPEWTYSFMATGDGRFDMAADLFDAGVEDLFLGAWRLRFSDNGASSETILTRGESGAGVLEVTGRFRHALTAGHNYTVSLVSVDGFGSNGDTTGLTGHAGESGGFRWSIVGGGNDAAVPEPSVWAMAVVGFGLAGAALRRRRRGFA